MHNYSKTSIKNNVEGFEFIKKLNEIYDIFATFILKFPFISKFLNKNSLAEAIKYLITGGSAFLLELSLFAICYSALHLHYLYANTIVYTIIFWFVYLINRKWSFKSNENFFIQIIKFLILFIFNLSYINSFLKFAADTLHMNVYLAKIAIMFIVVPLNFLIYKFIIFRKK